MKNHPGRPPGVRTFLLVNAAFALWFVMRNDVLLGWFAVTALLARRRIAYMAIPVALALTIAGAWAWW